MLAKLMIFGRHCLLGGMVMLLLAACAAQAAQPVPMPLTPVVGGLAAAAATTVPVPPAGYFATDTPVPTALPLPTITPAPTPTLAPTPTPLPVALDGPLTVAIAPGLPEEIVVPLMNALNQLDQVEAANGVYSVQMLDEADNATSVIVPVGWRAAVNPLAERFYAVVVPFETVQDDVTLEELQLRWLGLADGPILASSDTIQLLTPVLGASQAVLVEAGSLREQLEETPGALGIVPFDRIAPRFKVLTVDGIDVLSNQFDPMGYPLVVGLEIQGEGAELLSQRLQNVIEPATNRDPNALTQLIMTGVTAMSRGTADAIARTHPTYPADIISATLAAADITHVSNEVPFLADCEVNNTLNNLTLCSHIDYWAVLEAIGTDIVGLSGNHVNDFGRDGARESLAFYHDNEIPIYGSGLTIEEACAPLRWEHNGNTFAFVAALAFGPETAWVTDEEPGACHFYDHKEMILEMVRELAQEVDIVAVELQYLEIYEPSPTEQQVREFRELREAGADLVTGVQSHVPQAMEPYGWEDAGGPGFIAYGLGNLFFDQMWSWETRTELIDRHTIYQGRIINTEILTAVLEDFAQPRWAAPEERVEILNRVFSAAPLRPE